MSTLKFSSNTSGTGAFTIYSPNSDTDRTLTLPDTSGTLVTGTDSGWIFIGDTGAPAFENSWQDYDGNTSGGGYGSSRFRKINGVVYMEGLVTSGTVGTTIFTLPVGYRPYGYLINHPLTSGNGSARMDVRHTGEVIMNTGSNSWFSIWCSFVAAN